MKGLTDILHRARGVLSNWSLALMQDAFALWHNKRGVTSIEYALLVAVFAGVLLLSFPLMRSELGETFNVIGNSLSDSTDSMTEE